MNPVLSFQSVGKSYRDTSGNVRRVLDAVDFALPKASSVAILGPSGAGKSTLLNLAAGIDVPTSGRITLFDRDLGRVSDEARTRLRRDHVGFVFQFFHLLSHLSVVENVLLPSMIAGDRLPSARERAMALLARVGLADRAYDRVERLSGGEAQRVAICRALCRRPSLLLADEPTGNLDDASGTHVIDVLLELVRHEEVTLVVVTHDDQLAARAGARWLLRGGRLETP